MTDDRAQHAHESYQHGDASQHRGPEEPDGHEGHDKSTVIVAANAQLLRRASL